MVAFDRDNHTIVNIKDISVTPKSPFLPHRNNHNPNKHQRTIALLSVTIDILEFRINSVDTFIHGFVHPAHLLKASVSLAFGHGSFPLSTHLRDTNIVAYISCLFPFVAMRAEK